LGIIVKICRPLEFYGASSYPEW